MAAAPTVPDEAKELALIEKLRGNIALASSDEKLSTVLEKFLAPLLLKCKSPHPKVVQAVRSLCDHVRERVAPQAIRLPVEALLKQWQSTLLEETDGSTTGLDSRQGVNQLKLLRFYDMRFIKTGLSRLPASAQLGLLPLLLGGLAKTFQYSATECSEIFHLLLYVLKDYQAPETIDFEGDKFRQTLNLQDDDAQVASEWFAKLMLLRPPGQPGGPVPSQPLSQAEINFLCPPQIPGAWDRSTELGLTLGSTRRDVLNFLATGAFTESERFFAALFASGDSIPYVAERGEALLKRHVSHELYEETGIVERMYAAYFSGSTSQASNSIPLPVRTKILTHLSKSNKACQYPEPFSRMVTEGLAESSSESAPDGGDKRQKRGLEASKFRTAIFSYADFFIRHSDKEQLKPYVGPLLASIKGFLDLQGWPMPSVGQDLALRQNAYELMGFLSQATDFYDFGMVEWYFRSLEGDISSKEVGLSIEQGVSSLIGIFAKSVAGTPYEAALADVLLRHMTVANPESGRRTYYAAVRFANRCLPFDNLIARQIDMLAITGPFGDNREIVEEGRRGLDPWWFKLLNADHPKLWQTSPDKEEGAAFSFPSFEDAVRHLFNVPSLVTTSSFVDSVQEARMRLRDKLSMNTQIALAGVDFCRLLFLEQALQQHGPTPKLDTDWRRKLVTTAASDNDARAHLKAYIGNLNLNERFTFDMLLQVALNVMTVDTTTLVPDHETIFVDLLAVCPSSFLGELHYDATYPELLPLLKSNNVKLRTAASKALGILVAIKLEQTTNAEDLRSLISIASSWSKAVGSQINETHGAVLALGYILSRATLVATITYSTEKLALPDAPTKFLNEVLPITVEILLKSNDNTLLEASCGALGQIGLFKNIFNNGSEKEDQNHDPIIKKLATTANSGKESAILALGRLSVCLSEDTQAELLDKIYTEIQKLHDIRQIESQFAVGEALACLAGSWECSTLQLELDIDGCKPPSIARTKTLPRILEETIKNCKASKPKLRKAAVIWLLSLIQMLGHTEEIQSQLRPCQAAFKHCLSDRDELVQEAASRGLGLVYEQGDRELKDTLVRDLVGSFTENRASLAGNVTEDTQLFEEGALPTGDGSVTTYKDILSLAAEVGNPSLVYRFMSLAANNSIWTSRAAFGRFGLSNIFSDSSVDGYLAQNPKLYPKLYRYQFDPNPNVQRSMKDIWSALVKDTNRTLDQHFDAIITDLLESILTKEWRVRQASCAAIADLIQGRQFEKFEKYLPDIWKKCFMVLDDIKGSVQQAAMGLARVLSNLLLRSLEAGDSSLKGSTKMLENVLPFLRSNAGLGSSAQQVRLFASSILTSIVKKGSSKVLRPFIADLIDLLITQLSEAELEGIEYFRQRASEYKLTGQDIDDIRVKVLKRHPIMEGLERSLELLDENSIADFAKALENSIKSAIALPSKVGCSTVIVSMSTRHRLLFKPYAGRFLKLIEKAVIDRNDTVSNAYANAAGYLARLASDDEILKLADYSKKLYTTAEDERHRVISADIIHAISRHATDRFNSLGTDFLPFIFVAKNDDDEHVRKTYSATWDDNVGGSRAVFLYLREIITIAQSLLDSPKWSMKHTSARAIADATTTAASQTDDMSVQQSDTIWPALEKAIGGKSWDGKEVVVLAFAKFVEKAKPFWTGKPEVAKEITKIILREARRQNRAYQQHALLALSKVAASRTDLDMSEAVYETVEPVLEELVAKDADAMDVDAGDGKKDDALRDRILVAAVSAMQASLNLSKIASSDMLQRVEQFLEVATRANSVQSVAVSTTVFEQLGGFFTKVTAEHVKLWKKKQKSLAASLQSLLFKPVYNTYSEAVRLERAKAVLALAKSGWTEGSKDVLKEQLAGEIEQERASVVRDKLIEANKVVQG